MEQQKQLSPETHNLEKELRTQWRITIPLVAMNFTWFAKTAITTAFLGRLGELPLAGATLGFTFANVTGFSLLNGLCGAMEPICGQAFGANNFRLLHKTLLMSTTLLLSVSVPIAFLWLHVDLILIYFGQHRDLAAVSRRYLIFLIPDLVVISFLCPLKAYLSTQNVTVPIMLSSATAAAIHIPATLVLGRARGLEGIAMAVWISDVVVAILLAIYLILWERRKGGNWKEGGWLEQSGAEWLRLLKLSGPCCLTTCLEWWCYEIVVLLTGRLPSAQRSVGVLAIVLNFDYLLFSVMLSLATCASVRVSNELGAGRPRAARLAARVCLCVGAGAGVVGAGSDGLPLGVVLAFKVGMGLGGLLGGLFGGVVVCLVLLFVFIARIDWDDESRKALIMQDLVDDDDEDHNHIPIPIPS
ncbi:hypothetical protein SASPL_121029 [Salvia splendens]|uniref:Protein DETOXIFICATION n=1 Tax=Salvia splendens TaxID=180675 RepID=A0A8X8XRU7_SALSN|nr:hypothetical protein SASPL_121029 [Salvia splendens]